MSRFIKRRGRDVIIYPTSADTYIKLDGKGGVVIGEINLTNLRGEVVHRQVINANTYILHTNDFEDGFYTVTIQTDDEPYSKQIVIMHRKSVYP